MTEVTITVPWLALVALAGALVGFGVALYHRGRATAPRPALAHVIDAPTPPPRPRPTPIPWQHLPAEFVADDKAAEEAAAWEVERARVEVEAEGRGYVRAGDGLWLRPEDAAARPPEFDTEPGRWIA